MLATDLTSLINAAASFVWALSKLVWSIRRPPGGGGAPGAQTRQVPVAL